MNTTDIEKSLIPNPNPNRTKEEKEEDEAGLQASRISNAVAFPMVLKAAFEIGVIDTISEAGEGAWLSPSEIASRLPTKPTNPQAPLLLDRMLRLLTSYSILKCRTVRTGNDEIERVYATERVCQFFLTDNQDSGSLVPMFMLLHSDAFIKTWNHLKYMILDGRDAFTNAHGTTKIFEHMRRDEPLNDVFNRAMVGHSIMIVKKALEVYKGFEGVQVLVDMGGGLGTTLSLITSKYPNIKGINFDLARVLADAPSYPGVENVAGDMFVEVPKGDAIFMKWILHDWPDEDCAKFLRNCWRALPDKGKVIVVDTVVPENPEGGNVYSNIAFDLDMSVLCHCSGAKERTRTEFEALAKRSGFNRCEFICRAFYCWVIEFHKEA
ncbi:PREDICTED: indole glucosinolate O-methyltransferase 4-like [Tarenaya hassleriana]|uniref:indole glucosinolate O-methyltransferase 4-like n=1 Tax=Tarenaya hassleriana TaxID=28532 RepID=UPI00053C402F|nr:PREDICTED: indole glucosinolate O-methyltransferase 4-like [Tarenaya hassleriana]